VFVQLDGLVEGLMHVSETALPRGDKPQEHFHESAPVRVRILRIDEGEMKIGLSGVDEAGQALPAPAPVAATAEAEPAAVSASAEEPAPTPEAAEPGEAAAEAETEEAAPKKRRTRKKAEETPSKS
jgi:transcriptional accessory protein Tex/SPT6